MHMPLESTNIESVQPSCSCSSSPRAARTARWTAVLGVLAALGTCAACCLIPFGLLSVGIAGVWVSALESLEPYKWIFLAVAVAVLSYGFYTAYWQVAKACSAGAGCQACTARRSVRAWLWIAAFLVVSGVAFVLIEPRLSV